MLLTRKLVAIIGLAFLAGSFALSISAHLKVWEDCYGDCEDGVESSSQTGRLKTIRRLFLCG